MTTNEAILEEIEALQAILLDEINVNYTDCGNPSHIEITLMPATGQNVEEQHVRVTLVADISQGYPDVPPLINFRNPKGIDDEVLIHVENGVKKKCQEYLGCPVIYELTELVRESLTANNAPKCPCAICLFHFSPNDSFTKTECFHYYHSHCLGRYIENCNAMAAIQKAEEDLQPTWVERKKKEILCPVCREPLMQVFDCNELLSHDEAEEGKYLKDFNGDPEIRALQATMAALFQKQKANGGIIDLEEEKNRFLITSTSETTGNTSETNVQNKADESVPNQSVTMSNKGKAKNVKVLPHSHMNFSDRNNSSSKKASSSNLLRKSSSSNRGFENPSCNTSNKNQPGANTRANPESRRGNGRWRGPRGGAKTRTPPGFRPMQSENKSQTSS